jgi:MFS family permease
VRIRSLGAYSHYFSHCPGDGGGSNRAASHRDDQSRVGPDERAFAIGLYGASMGVASITAQLLGGFLVSADLFGWSWRLIFLINVPIGLAVIVYGLLAIRESTRSNKSKLDPIGVILSSSVVLLLVYPIVEGHELAGRSGVFGCSLRVLWLS